MSDDADNKSSKSVSAKPVRLISCPRCRKSTRYDPTNAFRPFCSALCKNEDIIAWAEHGYKIPGPPAAEEDLGQPKPADEDER